jgi:hypothetical protein
MTATKEPDLAGRALAGERAFGLYDYEGLDASIVETIVPEGMPQRWTGAPSRRCLAASSAPAPSSYDLYCGKVQ